MGDLLANHESCRSCSAVMLGRPPGQVNCLVRKRPRRDLRVCGKLPIYNNSRTKAGRTRRGLGYVLSV